jgi:hypothetical protein
MRTWEPTDANIYDVDADIEQSIYKYTVIAMASGTYVDSSTLPTIDVVINAIDSMTGKNDVNVYGGDLHSAKAYLRKVRYGLSREVRFANWTLSIARGIKNV